jgi:predicted nucleic acid-binding protein
MAFVLDASVALAWCFEDEATSYTRRVLRLLLREQAVVPPIWPFEVANALAGAIRARRMKPADAERFAALLDSFPLGLEPRSMDGVFQKVLPLAREQGLSCYDAAYLELARRLGLPLATLDRALRRAAGRVGVALVP